MGFYVGGTALKGAFLGATYTPNSYTLAYRPLKDDFNDYSGHGYTLSQTGTITLTTLNGVKCTKGGGGSSSYLQSTSATLPSAGAARTVMLRYAEPSTTGTHYIFSYGAASTAATFALQTDSLVFRFTNNSPISTGYTVTQNARNFYAVTYDSTNKAKFYVNGQLPSTSSSSTTLNTTAVSSSYPVRLFSRNTNTSYMSSGYLADVIVENRALTAQQILDYYNGVKVVYGL